MAAKKLISRYFLSEDDFLSFEKSLYNQYRTVTCVAYLEGESIFAKWSVQ